MEQSEHIALARIYVTASVRLEADGIHQLAAEAVWGAVCLAVEACRHARQLGHGGFSEKRRFMRGLDAVDTGQSEWEFSLRQSQLRLHNHFYTNQLSADRASHWLLFGRSFVDRLLQIAESPANQAGAT